MKKKRVLIIGAGIGGLGTAALLGKYGYEVTVLEKNDQIGGRAMTFEEKGFTFDMGPSWYLMPDIFEKYFQLFGKTAADFYDLVKLDPQYRIYYGSRDFVDISSNFQKNLKLFESLEPGVTPRLMQYLEECKTKYNLTIDHFLYRDFSRWSDLLDPNLAKALPQANIFENVDHYLSRFITSEKLKKILLYSMVFIGSAPKNTPSVYSILSHVDFNQGVYYPLGGVGKFIAALQTLCTEYNVKILTNQPVEHIHVNDGITTSVSTKDTTYEADIVVSNADYPFTEMSLLEKKWQTYPASYWRRKTIAPSAFVMYLGVKGRIKNLAHHTLFFEHDWEQHFDEIFTKPAWPEFPSYYVCCPSKTDSSTAPQGDENLFILVPIAPGLEDTPKIRARYSTYILQQFQKTIGENIEDNIVVRRIFSLNDYKKTYNAYEGTALGLAHTLFQTAIFRPSVRNKKVKNLYHVGQYAQPGVGMPMCLISAQVAVDYITHE